MKKQRREWHLYRNAVLVAKGIIYEQGNGQILWRRDIGWTGQQFSTVHTLLEIFPDADTFCRETQ